MKHYFCGALMLSALTAVVAETQSPGGWTRRSLAAIESPATGRKPSVSADVTSLRRPRRSAQGPDASRAGTVVPAQAFEPAGDTETPPPFASDERAPSRRADDPMTPDLLPPEAAKMEDRLRDEIDALTRTIARQRAAKTQTPAAAPTTPDAVPTTQDSRRSVPAPPSHPPAELPTPRSEPADVQSLGRVLFALGRFDEALIAYKSVDLTRLAPDDVVATQYMTAMCLRKIGRVPEASALYREVANSDVTSSFVEFAKWQLEALNATQQLQAQIKGLRARREALRAP